MNVVIVYEPLNRFGKHILNEFQVYKVLTASKMYNGF